MNLTLWQIEGALAGLMEAREDALAEVMEPQNPETEAAAQAQLVEIDNAIAEAVKSEVKKVDNIRGLWKHLQMLRDAAKEEAETMAARAKAFDRQLTVLKSAVQVTMEEMPWVEGKPRKLEGKMGTLYLKANGGKEPVIVTDEALVPDEYRTVSARFPGPVWRAIAEEFDIAEGAFGSRNEPSLTLIADGLGKPCACCDGHPFRFSEVPCSECGGTGKQGVPGAAFGIRGSHVEVR